MKSVLQAKLLRTGVDSLSIKYVSKSMGRSNVEISQDSVRQGMAAQKPERRRPVHYILTKSKQSCHNQFSQFESRFLRQDKMAQTGSPSEQRPYFISSLRFCELGIRYFS